MQLAFAPPLLLVLALLPTHVEAVDQWDAAAEAAYARLASRPSSTHPLALRRRGDGVLYSMGGRPEFVEQEVVPCVRHLRRLGTTGTRFALFSERRLLAVSAEVASFFDEIVALEDVLRRELTPAETNVRVKVKLMKAYAMLYAPFERFVWLDFDSRPCAPDFAQTLLSDLERRNVDALLHNQWPGHQDALRGDAHYRIEHNSAIAVFDTRSDATRFALRAFVDAFELWGGSATPPRRDQPPLMVALRLAFHARNFSHADLDAKAFCRKNATDVVSCDAGCLVVHKPMKYDFGALVVGIGHRGTGSRNALAALLATLKLANKAPCPLEEDSLHARTDDTGPAATLLQQQQNSCKVLVGVSDAADVAALARRFPRAKFVHTVSSEPCPDEDSLNKQLRAALLQGGSSYGNLSTIPAVAPPPELFTLDLAAASHDRGDVWRRFCAFLEVWSSCKSRELAKIAGGWTKSNAARRQRHPCSPAFFNAPS